MQRQPPTADRELVVQLRADARAAVRAVLDEVDKAVVGKREVVRQILLAISTSGHVLLEDVPGLGKTLIARSVATALGLTFTRLQFTPDLLPSDVTGTTVYDPARSELTFRPGPVFTNVLLADEINRTPPKTQAALLEAMAERQVSVDGMTHRLPDPFLVLATDNPVELDGTYPLPEAQLDRFAVRLAVGYPTPPDEAELFARRIARNSDEVELRPVAALATVPVMRRAVESIEMSGELIEYVTRILNATRNHKHVELGASPRGGLALVQMARARALYDGRDFVLPDDVKALAVPALAHRISVRPELWVRRLTGVDVVREVLATVPTPVLPAP